MDVDVPCHLIFTARSTLASLIFSTAYGLLLNCEPRTIYTINILRRRRPKRKEKGRKKNVKEMGRERTSLVNINDQMVAVAILALSTPLDQC